MSEEYCVRMDKVTKRYPGTLALDNVDFAVRKGEIHGLVGKNGAGKSTLMNILYGRIQRDSGKIFIYDREISDLNPVKAKEYGIGVVPQELELIPELTVAENLFLGRLQYSSLGFVMWRRLFYAASEILAKAGIRVDVTRRVSDLSLGEQKLLSIQRVFSVLRPKIAILDEPSAPLSKNEEETLHGLIKDFVRVSKDNCVILISHKLEEIFLVCSCVTTLRDGRNVSVRDVTSLDIRTLAREIIGKDQFVKKSVNESEIIARGEEVLSIQNLTTRLLKDVNIVLNKGEIIGLAGLRGSGRTEICRAITGLDNRRSGIIKVNCRQVDIRTPIDALKEGIILLTEDREKTGYIRVRSVRENITISFLDKLIDSIGFLDNRRESSEVSRLIKLLDVKLYSFEQEMMYLSGGNKQKVIIGKLVGANPIVYILDEPTKGIDVEAKSEILNYLSQLGKRSAVIIVSSEIEDLLSICTRILVLYKGQVVREFTGSEFSKEDIYQYMEGMAT